jgi:hypothetical protein
LLVGRVRHGLLTCRGKVEVLRRDSKLLGREVVAPSVYAIVEVPRASYRGLQELAPNSS